MPRVTPEVPIILDRPRHLRLDNRAIFSAEKELSALWGKKVSLFTVLGSGELGLNDLSVLLWQGLRHEDPGLTLERVQDLMDMSDLPGLIEKVLASWNAATTPAEPRQETPDAPFPNGSSGPASGATGALSLASATTSSGA